MYHYSEHFMRTLFFLSILTAFCASTSLKAQCGGTFKVLHYSETTGYDHNTRNQSLGMFQGWESVDNFVITSDNDGSEFNTLANLQQYAVVVFSNTSGNSGLDATQRSNFEAYINAGGSYLGIHAATDTYRHSTANGNKTGTWDWYAENVAGASVQESPNHTSQNHNNTMTHQQAGHPTLANVPDPWNKTEEYYYWENGYLNNSFLELLEVASTGGNSYDAARMMAHCKELTGGGRAFYTALGHSGNNYTGDQNFQNLIRDAMLWTAEPNISSGGGAITATVEIVTEILCNGEKGELNANPTSGKAPYNYSWSTGATSKKLANLEAGKYTVTITDDDGCTVSKSKTLAEPEALGIMLSAQPNTSATGNGSINTSVSGGVKPYTYKWTGPGNYASNIKYPTDLKAGSYTLKVVDDNACKLTETIVVEEDFSASLIEDLGVNSFTVQPNPASDQVTILLETQNPMSAGVELLDLQGKVVAAQNTTLGFDFEWEISLTNISPGYYFARVVVGEGQLIRKLVVR